MRTTVTLDPDVAEKLTRLAHARKASFKETLNDVLRRGLSGQETAPKKPFVLKPHRGTFAPGVDLLKLNQLVDELAIEDFLRKAGR
jgi:hypothetical protein